MDDDLDRSAVDWVIDYPNSARVFDELGIDAYCPGKSLGYLCRERGLDPRYVLRRLREAASAGDDSDSASDVSGPASSSRDNPDEPGA